RTRSPGRAPALDCGADDDGTVRRMNRRTALRRLGMVTGASLTGSLVVPATARAHGGGHHGGGHHGGGHHGGGHHGGGHHGGGHHGGGHHGGCNGNAEDVVLGLLGA